MDTAAKGATAPKKTPAKDKPAASQGEAPAAPKAGIKDKTEVKAEGLMSKPAVISKAPETPAPAATTGVQIEIVEVPGRMGRTAGEETYPFSKLTPATKTDSGSIKGPSFFIPRDDGPNTHLATARKRHKGQVFWSRKMTAEVNGKEVDGVRVWLAPEGTQSIHAGRPKPKKAVTAKA